MPFRTIEELKNEIFRQCGLEQCTLIGCYAKEYMPGEAILHQGDLLNSLYVIAAGHVRVCTQVSNGKELTLCQCSSGDILGDVCFMIGCSMATTSVTAISNTTCLVIPLSEYMDTLKTCAPFLNYVGKSLAEKLLARGDAQTTTALAPAKIRLCLHILQTENGGFFREPLTETAQILGISYRHVFRLLGELCKDGTLEHTKSGYRILDDSLLHSYTEETP